MIWSFYMLTGIVYLLRTYCMAHTPLGAMNAKKNKTLKVSALVELNF